MIITQHHDGSFTIVGIEHAELEEMWLALVSHADGHELNVFNFLDTFGAIAGALNRRDELAAYRQVDTSTPQLF